MTSNQMSLDPASTIYSNDLIGPIDYFHWPRLPLLLVPLIFTITYTLFLLQPICKITNALLDDTASLGSRICKIKWRLPNSYFSGLIIICQALQHYIA